MAVCDGDRQRSHSHHHLLCASGALNNRLSSSMPFYENQLAVLATQFYLHVVALLRRFADGISHVADKES